MPWGHAGTLKERPDVTGPWPVWWGTSRVLRQELEGGPEARGAQRPGWRGHNCRGAKRSAAAGHKCTPAACEYLTRPNKSACIINQADTEKLE